MIARMMVRLSGLGLILALGLAGCTTPQATPSHGGLSSAARPVSEQESVYFDADSTIIAASAQETIRAVGTLLRMNKDLSVTLIGRTDQNSNSSLALRRAIAVRNALSQNGISPDRMIVQDEARSDHILSQQSPEKSGEVQSRRVDILMNSIPGEDA